MQHLTRLISLLTEKNMFPNFLIPVFNSIRGLFFGASFGQDIFLKKYYELSHAKYLDKEETYLKEWKPISDYCEYSLHLATVLSNTTTPVSMVAIRKNKKITENITDISLSFEVRTDTAVYQENFQIKDLSDNTAIHQMKNIPPQDVWLNNDGIQASYKEYQLALYSLSIDNKKVITEPVKAPTYLVQKEPLKGSFKQRWGKIWNLDFYETAKMDFKISLISSILSPEELKSLEEKNISGTGRLLWVKFRKAVSGIFESPYVINFLFFIFGVFSLIKVSEKGEVNCRFKFINVFNMRKWLKVNPETP
ncbi:MAG: hypothetical protein JWM09_219 [Francisellaceae bacterium]|nr:hypothetical protein [Francisellaceae bacterium]